MLDLTRVLQHELNKFNYADIFVLIFFYIYIFPYLFCCIDFTVKGLIDYYIYESHHHLSKYFIV